MATQFIIAPYTYKVQEEDQFLTIQILENNNHIATTEYYIQDQDFTYINFTSQYQDPEFQLLFKNSVQEELLSIAKEMTE